MKAQRHWPLCREFTGDRWILCTKGQWRVKSFHWWRHHAQECFPIRIPMIWYLAVNNMMVTIVLRLMYIFQVFEVLCGCERLLSKRYLHATGQQTCFFAMVDNETRGGSLQPVSCYTSHFSLDVNIWSWHIDLYSHRPIIIRFRWTNTTSEICYQCA